MIVHIEIGVRTFGGHKDFILNFLL